MEKGNASEGMFFFENFPVVRPVPFDRFIHTNVVCSRWRETSQPWRLMKSSSMQPKRRDSRREANDNIVLCHDEQARLFKKFIVVTTHPIFPTNFKCCLFLISLYWTFIICRALSFVLFNQSWFKQLNLCVWQRLQIYLQLDSELRAYTADLLWKPLLKFPAFMKLFL